jgi:endonuclease-3
MSFDWNKHLEPLFVKYGKLKHPLDYKNRYQLVIMVILSAQDSDRHINELARKFFEAYPSVERLATATLEELVEYIGSVTNYRNKTKWIVSLARIVGEDDKIPTTLAELTRLPGIGRKSANVIIRESGGKAEGIIVDLHVIRVAPRIGIATGDKPEKIEKQLMAIIPEERWNEAGMAISFLGREICRPTNPNCSVCVMNPACRYYNEVLKNTGKFR